MSKDTETLLEAVKRLSNIHRERCKTDPVLREEMERSREKGRCSKTHKVWLQDGDVHGLLNRHCARCGAWEPSYSPQFYYKQSFMTCDDVLADKKK